MADPQVTSEKLEELNKAIRAKLKEMFREDEDGDFPVDWILINRETSEPTLRHFTSIIREEMLRTPADRLRCLLDLVGNVQSAAQDLDMHLRVTRYSIEAEDRNWVSLCDMLQAKDSSAVVNKVSNLIRSQIKKDISSQQYQLGPASDRLVYGQRVSIRCEDTKDNFVEELAQVEAIVPKGCGLTVEQAKNWMGNYAPTAREIRSYTRPANYERVIIKRPCGRCIVLANSKKCYGFIVRGVVEEK